MDYLKFEDVIRVTRAKKVGDSWMGHCPTHEDKTPSLSIKDRGNGEALVNCFAGCGSERPYKELAANNAKAAKRDNKNIEYHYHNLKGEVALRVVKKPGKQGFYQMNLDYGEWRKGRTKQKIQPYKYNEWKNESLIFFVEGEKDVENLMRIGLSATTTGSSNSWSHEYTDFFKGRDVVILPDNDVPGEKYANEACKDISFKAKSVKIINLPNLIEKGDVSDWLAAGNTKNDLLKLVGETGVELKVKNEGPMLLFRELPPALEFPVHALGKYMAPAVDQLREFIQAPVEIAAQSVLAAVAQAVQPHYNVVFNELINPLSLNFLTIAVSGEGKSLNDKQALKMHKGKQVELWNLYEDSLKEYKKAEQVFNAARKQVFNKNKNKLDIERELGKLGEEPELPIAPHLLLEDLTTEALLKQFEFGLPSVGIFSDEGGQLLGGFSFNVDNAKKTASALSKIWDGSEISRIRAGGDSTRSYGRRASLHLMTQPKIASDFLTNEVFRDQGLINRLLFSWPESRIGTRSFKEVKLAGNSLMESYWERVKFFLDKSQPMHKFLKNALDPEEVHLTPEAGEIWIEYFNRIERACGKEGEFFEIRSYAARSAQQALRLAGVIAVFDGEKEVPVEYMLRDANSQSIT